MFGWLKRSKTSTTEVPKQKENTSAPLSVNRSVPSTPAPQPPEPIQQPPANSNAGVNTGEPPPSVGMPALEIAPNSRSRAVVTLVHPDHHRIVARIEKTGIAYSYLRQPDGTYRLAGRAKANSPRLVIGVE